MCNHPDPRPLRYSLVRSDFVEGIWGYCQVKPANVEFFRVLNLGLFVVELHVVLVFLIEKEVGIWAEAGVDVTMFETEFG